MNDNDPTIRQHEAKKAIEPATRRELALRAIDAVSEVLERDVNLPDLMETADQETASPEARLLAKRALRSIISTADQDSKVMQTVGEQGIYPFVEGVVMYGASDRRYLALMSEYALNPEETTGLYALRELIAEQVNNVRPSFQQIFKALEMLGISVRQAANMPDETVAAFDEAGFFTDHSRSKQFNATIFFPALSEASVRIVEDDADGSVTEGIQAGIRENLQRPSEESEEDDSWPHDARTKYLKNSGF